jgi:2-iminobutanoate/2-iminopropanoate deaminase
MNRRVYVVGAILLAGAVFAAKGALSDPARFQEKKVINAPGKNPQLPFSNAILEGNTLYMSGSIGLDPKTGKAPEKVEDEIKLLLDGYKSLLAQAGMSMDDLVYVQISCTDLSYYDKFNEIYKTYFSRDFPTREFVGVAALLRGGHFEMQAIAVSHSVHLQPLKK